MFILLEIKIFVNEYLAEVMYLILFLNKNHKTEMYSFFLLYWPHIYVSWAQGSVTRWYKSRYATRWPRGHFFQKTTLGPRGDASLGPPNIYGFDMWGQYSHHMALLIGLRWAGIELLTERLSISASGHLKHYTTDVTYKIMQFQLAV